MLGFLKPLLGDSSSNLSNDVYGKTELGESIFIKDLCSIQSRRKVILTDRIGDKKNEKVAKEAKNSIFLGKKGQTYTYN